MAAAAQERDELQRIFVDGDRKLLVQRFGDLMWHIQHVSYSGNSVIAGYVNAVNRRLEDARMDPVRTDQLMKSVLLLCARFEPVFWAEFGKRCRASVFKPLHAYLISTFAALTNKPVGVPAELQSPTHFLQHVSHRIAVGFDSYGDGARLHTPFLHTKPGAAIAKRTTTLP